MTDTGAKPQGEQPHQEHDQTGTSHVRPPSSEGTGVTSKGRCARSPAPRAPSGMPEGPWPAMTYGSQGGQAVVERPRWLAAVHGEEPQAGPPAMGGDALPALPAVVAGSDPAVCLHHRQAVLCRDGGAASLPVPLDARPPTGSGTTSSAVAAPECRSGRERFGTARASRMTSKPPKGYASASSGTATSTRASTAEALLPEPAVDSEAGSTELARETLISARRETTSTLAPHGRRDASRSSSLRRST